MAELYLSYNELEKIIDKYINDSQDKDILVKYKAEILSSITGDFESNDMHSANETVSLWKNQINKPSQLLLGTKYVQIQKILLDFVSITLTSGFLEALITYSTQNSNSAFTLTIGASVTVALWRTFTSVKELNDWDLCIYQQAVTHYREHKKFTVNDLLQWFPHGENNTCNMHNDKWDCDYYKSDDNSCIMLSQDNIEKALKSLYYKNLLKVDKKLGEYEFKFVR